MYTQLLGDLHIQNNLKIYFLTQLLLYQNPPPLNLHHWKLQVQLLASETV